MRLEQAQKEAENIINGLRPFCLDGYLQVAGSVRRKKKEIDHDIEIVCIPKQISIPDGLFDNKIVRHPGFAEYLDQFPKAFHAPGNATTGKSIKRVLPCGLQIDVYVADQDNWGYIFAIRTGSENFSHKFLANGWVDKGYFGSGGYLRNPSGTVHPVPTEEYLFELLGEEFIEPEFRI